MKAGWFGWPNVGAVVLALLFCGAGQTWAATIDFEDLMVPSGTRLTPDPGIGVVSRGFNYTPGPISGSSGFNDLHISNKFLGDSSNVLPDSFNGTTVGISHDDVVLTEKYGGTFSLQRFDFAGFPTDKEVSFTLTGVRDGFPIIITQPFNLISPSCLVNCLVDGEVDGLGEEDDFQTFYLDGNWTNLKSVTWTHTGYGYGTDRGLFALDNMVVYQTKVPEPSTMTLLGLGILCLLGQARPGRKQLKALGDMA